MPGLEQNHLGISDNEPAFFMLGETGQIENIFATDTTRDAIMGIHTTLLIDKDEKDEQLSHQESLKQTIKQNIQQIIYAVVKFKQGLELRNSEMTDESLDTIIELMDEHHILEWKIVKLSKSKNMLVHIEQHTNELFLQKFHPFIRQRNYSKIFTSSRDDLEQKAEEQLERDFDFATEVELFFAHHLSDYS